MVLGVWCMFWGLELEVWRYGVRDRGVGFEIRGRRLGFGVGSYKGKSQGFGFGVWSFGFCGLNSVVWLLRFGVWELVLGYGNLNEGFGVKGLRVLV